MKQVWKCDHCSQTSIDVDEIKQHEERCCFNPIFKKCWSCDHYYDYYGTPDCDVALDIHIGENKGECSGWHNQDWVKSNRDNKINQIIGK